MKQTLILLALTLLSFICLAQVTIVTNNNLIINHGDITLYLSNDTSTMVSKHVLTYANFKHIGKYPRDNHWFQDTYKGKYNREDYKFSGYDLGHLTPSSITSYDSIVNHASFSMFNEAPQLRHFNEHPWEQLEMHVQDSIAKYKTDAVIITGVIYNFSSNEFLPKSRIRIPVAYYKILVLKAKTYAWIGSNSNEIINTISVDELNQIFLTNEMNLVIK